METISYAQSPFADYLTDTGTIEEDLVQDEENYHDAVEEEEEVIEPPPLEIEEEEQIKTPPVISLLSPSAKNNKKDQFSDRLGYALVTSSLLTTTLGDALILYPTSHRQISSSTLTSPTSVTTPLPPFSPPTPPPPTSQVKKKKEPLEWGKDWDTRGQLFSRGTLNSIIVFIQDRIQSHGVSSSSSSHHVPIAGTPIDKSKPYSTHDLVLETIDSFVSIAQEVDLKIARALVGIKEVENVGIEQTLSDQELTPSSAFRRRPNSISIAPPYLRSLPLRENLFSSLHIINTQIASSLNSIRPPTSPTLLSASLITPSTSPSLISNARLSSPIHFDSNPSTSTSTSTSSTLQELDPNSYQPNSNSNSNSKRNTWDGTTQTFGGVDRTTISSSPTRRIPESPVTIWENSPPSPISPSANSSNNPQKRRRPSSLHIWSVPPPSATTSSNNSTSTTSNYSISNPSGGTLGRSGSLKRYSGGKSSMGEENLTSLYRSNSTRERSLGTTSRSSRRVSSSEFNSILPSLSSSISAGTTTSNGTSIDLSNPTSLDSLQLGFESIHSNRLVLLWRLIHLSDPKSIQVEDEEWLTIRTTLEELVTCLKKVSESVTLAVESQFGSGSETFLINNGRNSRLSMLSESDLYSTQSKSVPPSPTPLSSFAPNHSNSILGPQAALNRFEEEINKMMSQLRIVGSKLSVVKEEISRRRTLGILTGGHQQLLGGGEEAGEEEELVLLHDSLKGDLGKLTKEWEESRISLREFVRGPKPRGGGGGLFKSTNESTNEVLPSSKEEEEEEPLTSPLPRSSYSTGPLGERNHSLIPTTTTSQAQLDATLSNHLPPSHGPELIYESIVGVNDSSKIERGGEGGGISREERIKLVKAERRKGSIIGISGGGTGSGTGIGMVEELKDVLELLKGRNKIPATTVVV